MPEPGRVQGRVESGNRVGSNTQCPTPDQARSADAPHRLLIEAFDIESTLETMCWLLMLSEIAQLKQSSLSSKN